MFVIAGVFIISGIINICGFFFTSNTAVEYILIPDSTASLVTEKIDKLCDSDDVITASLQRRYIITVGINS